MTFDPEQAIIKTPTTIRSLEVTLWDSLYADDRFGEKKYVHVEIRVDDQSGQPINWVRADLENHLTPTQITQLISFMNMLRDKAEQEILP